MRIDDHGINCTCDACRQCWDKCPEPDGSSEPSTKDLDPEYTKDSLISKQILRVNELVSAHWSYIKKVLSTGQNHNQTFTWDQVMAMREFDYISVAKHFYGHGYEDAVNNTEQMQRRL